MDELKELIAEVQASCEGFNRKDIGAWLDPFHENAVTYNRGFMDVSTIRPIAQAVIDSAKSFTIDNVDGRIVDDTAILFGDFRFELNDGTVESGAFTMTCARTNGEWKTLLTHYTPK